MISTTVEAGQRNMVVLEQSVIKDNTLMPGEWYGGQLTWRHPPIRLAVKRPIRSSSRLEPIDTSLMLRRGRQDPDPEGETDVIPASEVLSRRVVLPSTAGCA